MAKFSPTKLNQTEFFTNKGINSYIFTEGALDFSPTKRNLLLILEISYQPVGENSELKSATLFNLASYWHSTFGSCNSGALRLNQLEKHF